MTSLLLFNLSGSKNSTSKFLKVENAKHLFLLSRYDLTFL